MATDYLEQAVLAALCRGQAYAVSSGYLGLWLASPGVTGDQTAEVSAPDYQRMPVTWSTTFSNENLITWTPTSSWGQVSYVVWLDSATGGNVLDFVTYSILLNASRGLQILPGALSVAIA